MVNQETKPASASKARRTAKQSGCVSVASSQRDRRSLKAILTEPTTWAGLLTVAATVATGGVGALTSPTAWAQLGAGLALVFAREG